MQQLDITMMHINAVTSLGRLQTVLDNARHVCSDINGRRASGNLVESGCVVRLAHAEHIPFSNLLQGCRGHGVHAGHPDDCTKAMQADVSTLVCVESGTSCGHASSRL